MPSTPIVTIIDATTKTMDRTPTFRWRLTTGSAPNLTEEGQTAFKVRLERQNVDLTYSQVLPVDTGTLYETHDGSDGLDPKAKEYTLAQPLATGSYRFTVAAQSTVNNWANPVSTTFQVVPTNEVVRNWDANKGTPGVDDDGFEDWPGQTNVDIDTDPERVGVLEISPHGYITGTLILQHDITVPACQWETCQWESDETYGSSIAVACMAADTLAALDATDAQWTDIAGNGGDMGVVGRYLRLKITLTPSPDATVAPHLYRILALYDIPAVTDTRRTYELKVDAAATPPRNDFQDPTIPNLRFGTPNQPNTTVAGDAGVILAQGDPLIEYSLEEGTLVLRHDAKTLSLYDTLRLYGDHPAGTWVKCYARGFNNTVYAEDAAWVLLYDGSLDADPSSGYMDGSIPLSIAFHRKRYLDIKLVLKTTNTDITPAVHKVILHWYKLVAPSERYAYTTTVNLPTGSLLSKLVLVANETVPDGTYVEYRLGTQPNDTWDVMQPIPPQTWVDTITRPGPAPFIGARLVSGSDVAYPYIEDINYQVHTDHDDILPLSNDRPASVNTVEMDPAPSMNLT